MLSTARCIAILGALGLATTLAYATACGHADGPPEQRFPFTDENGRKCTQAKFGLTAECDADAAPRDACKPESTPCYVVLVPTADGGGITGDLASLQPTSSMWNCAACCNPAATRWIGVTSDCSPILCKIDGDCAAEAGRCENGRCLSARK